MLETGRAAGSGHGGPARRRRRRARRTRRRRPRAARGRRPSSASRRSCSSSSCARSRTGGGESCSGHYLIGGLGPRTAEPTRTCVAPHRTASSRSALMPAEIHRRTRVSARRRSPATSASRWNAGQRRLRPAARPPSRPRRRRLPAVERPGVRERGDVRRGGAAATDGFGRVQADLDQAVDERGPRRVGTAVERADELGPVDGLDDVGCSRRSPPPCCSGSSR